MSAENSGHECVVKQPPSRQPPSTCTSKPGASNLSSCARRRSSKLKRKMSRSRCLIAIEHRNQLRKLAARRVRIASNWLSPASLLRWEKRFDREYEKEFEETRVALERLRQERDVLLANRRLILKGVSFHLLF
ncbi:hypothetical protein Angca_002067, partial [Angiostrongylus cantonensis]